MKKIIVAVLLVLLVLGLYVACNADVDESSFKETINFLYCSGGKLPGMEGYDSDECPVTKIHSITFDRGKYKTFGDLNGLKTTVCGLSGTLCSCADMCTGVILDRGARAGSSLIPICFYNVVGGTPVPVTPDTLLEDGMSVYVMPFRN